jgi:signal transduction histidine kinase
VLLQDARPLDVVQWRRLHSKGIQMNNVEALADRMSAKLQKDLEAKGFIVTTFIVVSALISIIVNLVKLNQMCKYSPKDALDHIREPNIIEKIKIRRVIRNGLKDSKLKIPKGVAGDPAISVIEKAVSTAAQLINEEDVTNILKSVEE